MSRGFESRPGRSAPDTLARRSTDAVGKHTLTEHAGIPPVQRKADAVGKHTLTEHASIPPTLTEHASIPPVAAAGISGTGSPMPHRHAIQSLFGRHDISHVEAHCDDRAAAATAALGAEAYATGSHVAFASSSPSLHTAAHEAVHVVQQGAGVRFAGGVGQTDDAYEQHADAVAERVVNGESAEDLLDHHADASTGADPAVQMKSKGSKAFGGQGADVLAGRVVPPTEPEGPCPEPPRRATQREVSAVIDSVVKAYRKLPVADALPSNLITKHAGRFADKQRNMRKNGHLYIDAESERAERETLENAVREGFRSASLRRRGLGNARSQEEIIQQLKSELGDIYAAATHDICGKKPGIFEFR